MRATKVGIHDVASEAGVSTATVSHVINNTRYVSDEVRARVLAAVERCEYYPNAIARSLASGRSHVIGLVISDISNPFFPDLVKSIESAAFERGYDVVLSNTGYDPARTSLYIKRFIERNVAGVAVMTSELDAALVSELARRCVPVVFLDLGQPGAHTSNLRVDYETGIEEAIRHLVSFGHRDVALIGGPPHLRSAACRLEAFRASMQRHLPGTPARVYEGDFKLEGGKRAALDVLAEPEMPSAIIVSNDMMALGAMAEFNAAGLRIPQDISIIGFDNISFAALSEPQLTTICLPRKHLGRRAVEALLATIENPDKEGTEILITTHLVVRGSTGPAASPARGAKLQLEEATGGKY